MIDIFLNKLMLLLLVLSVLNTLRHAFFFIIDSLILEKKYVLSKWSLICLGISLSYIITVIISGYKLS